MSMPQQPRFFWRRIAAHFVDVLLAFAITTLLLWPVFDPDGPGMRLSQIPVHSQVCQNVTQLPQQFHDRLAPKPINSAQLCTHQANGIYNGRTIEMVYDLQAGQTDNTTSRSYKSLTVSVDKDGNIVTAFHPQDVMIWFVLLLASAALLRAGRQSPGKRLLGLVVRGEGCPLCREIRRIGPILVVSVASLLIEVTGVIDRIEDVNIPLSGLAMFGVIGVFAAYYVLPWLRWRGAMPWDRATGFIVSKRA